MVRSDSRQAASDQFGALYPQRPFEVDMIEMHERQQTWIAAALPHMQLKVEALEPVRQHACRQSFDPLIEISDQNTRPRNTFMNLLRGEETFDLMPPLEITCAHVNVEDVQRAERGFQIGSDAASPSVMRPGQIHVGRPGDWPPAQECIAVRPAAV